MSDLKTFEDLDCWKACRSFKQWCREIAARFPPTEKYGLKDQLMRAARSATANIAEGYGRFHYQETIQFCRHARGSCYEVLDHIIEAHDSGYIEQDLVAECRKHLELCVKLINGYIRYLQSRKKEG